MSRSDPATSLSSSSAQQASAYSNNAAAGGGGVGVNDDDDLTMERQDLGSGHDNDAELETFLTDSEDDSLGKINERKKREREI